MYKSIIISILFSILSMYCFSQTTIRYDYDIAGNMVVRSVITLKSSVFENEIMESDTIKKETELNAQKDIEPQNEEAFVGESKIIIYPNPTKGKLRIEVQNITDYNIVKVIVYSSIGQVVHESDFSGSQKIVDLSANPRGIYFMHIKVGDKKREWKIILQ